MNEGKGEKEDKAESSDDDYTSNMSDEERLKTQIEEIEDIRLELMNKYP